MNRPEPGTNSYEAAALGKALDSLNSLHREYGIRIGVHTDAEITVEPRDSAREPLVYRLVLVDRGYELREQYR